MPNPLPKYTASKMKGNIGESIAQYILSTFALVHKIDGSNDVGNDFICELIRDESPTNLLFYVQVKFTKNAPIIRRETLEYWRGSPIPVYLFWIKDLDQNGSTRQDYSNIWDKVKYKRYTPFLHQGRGRNKEKFKIFEKIEFLHDLIIDYTRTQYVKGFTPILRPRDFLTMEDKLELGLPRYRLFIHDIIPEYREQILAGAWANLFSLAIILERNGSIEDKEQALKIIEVARTLINSNDRENYPQIVGEIDLLFERLSRQN